MPVSSQPLPQRQLGRAGPLASAIGFGCMGLDTGYGDPVDRAAGIAVLRRAVECGITLFDTAELYGPYTNERLVGEALRPVRDIVLIATKFGARIVDGRPVGLDSRLDTIVATVDAALERLGTDRIDLLFQHRVDPDVPIEDVAGTVGRLIDMGKVRALGLSEPSAATLRRAHAVHPVAAVQSEYSLWTRDPEHNGIFAACEELDIGFVAFSPLGRGFLAGSVTTNAVLAENDARRRMPRFQPDAAARNAGLAKLIADHAARHGATPAQFAIGWLLAQRPWLIPIPGTRSVRRVQENAMAAKLELSSADWCAFDEAVAIFPIDGLRYPEDQLALTGK